MFGMTPPWANFLAGASDKVINPVPPSIPRTSYGRPILSNQKPAPSIQGPNVGRMTRNPLADPTPNMGYGGALPPMYQTLHPDYQPMY